MGKEKSPNWDDPQARRLRQLRKAEGFGNAQAAFGKKLGWNQSEISMYENGERPVPAAKVLKMHRKIPGFAPLWFTEGQREGLSFDLRRRLDAVEAEEASQAEPQTESGREAS